MNKWYVRFLIFVGVLPVVIQYIGAHMQALNLPPILMQILTLLVLVFGLVWAFRIPFLGGVFRVIGGIFHGILSLLSSTIGFLIPGRVTRGSRFMRPWSQFLLLNSFHKGFLVDGYKRRFSKKVSFQSLLTVAGVGKGKTSTFIIPNLLTLDNCSMVALDTSGELYDQTSGYLKNKGFDIQVLDLMNVTESQGYNPLKNASNYTEIAQVANLIMRSAMPTDSDPFWTAGGEKIIRIFIQCLKNLGDDDYVNLANVKYLLNNWDAGNSRGSRIDNFVARATVNDSATFYDYKGFISGNEKTVLSFLSTADTALNALGNPDIANLTARHDFDFKRLRRRKTVLYVKVRQQDLQFYSFILNQFFTELFNSLLSDLSPRNIPCYLLLDEFGHLTIPNFEVFATTARKYKVGFWVMLQSLAQLESRYGRSGAETILDGLQSEIYFGGIALDTAKSLERRMGNQWIQSGFGRNARVQQEHLMTESEIIQMRDNEVLIFHSNKPPIKLRTKPFYKQGRMLRASRLRPVQSLQSSDIGQTDKPFYIPL